MTHRNFLSLAVTAFVVLAIVSLAPPAVAQTTSQTIAASSVLEEIKRRGMLRIGMSTFIPWAMRNKQGELIGYEIDVAKQLADDAGWKVEFIPTSWDGIIPALLAGKFDTIISGMASTTKRSLTVNFTIPYEYYGTLLVANKEVAGGKSSLEDFNDPGIIFVSRRGGANLERNKALVPKARWILFDDEPSVQQELLNGRAHAAIGEAPQPSFWVADHPTKLYLPLGTQMIFRGVESFAIRKGDPDFMAFLNNWIINRREEGWLEERYDYWFGGRDWADQIVEK